MWRALPRLPRPSVVLCPSLPASSGLPTLLHILCPGYDPAARPAACDSAAALYGAWFPLLPLHLCLTFITSLYSFWLCLMLLFFVFFLFHPSLFFILFSLLSDSCDYSATTLELNGKQTRHKAIDMF